MAKKTITAPCDPCKGLVADSAGPRLNGHDALTLEWQRETVAIYHCASCGITLTHNSRDPKPWRAGVL